jgi:hypothetical protein
MIHLEHIWLITTMAPRIQVPVADEHAGWVPDEQDGLPCQLVHVVVPHLLLVCEGWSRALV